MPAFPLPRRSRHRLMLGLTLMLGLLALIFLTDRLCASDVEADPDAIGSGTLMLRGKGVANAMPAMRLGTDMDVTVSGQIARVRVTQAFRNGSSQWMEASYLYPLPDDGAVDSLKMVVGQRVIIGHIKRREEARALYEKARDDGKKAALVESERPNLFRNSVANVGPGETVLIAIEYQAPVRQLGGEYALRLPLVVGTRYIPAQTPAADAANVSAPLAHPALGKGINPVSITVHLAPGFKPANLISPYHRIAIDRDGAETRTIRLADGQVPADRDFELRWRSANADPTIGLFRERHEGEAYLMAAITPPRRDPATTANRDAPPRDMTFVIDNSGSMGGASMDAAKDSLLYALGTLRPQDRFNIIRFDDSMTRLFHESVAASPDQIALGRRFTQGLEADGGTEMLPALTAALEDNTPDDSHYVRQVLFLTDGNISNEKEMMATIAAKGGRSRIFMIGIGSAPNQYLMRRTAEAGRGTFTNVGSGEDVAAKMTALLDRLKAPVVRDLKVRLEGAPLDLTPRRLPDLYAGEPLVLLGKGKAQNEGLSGKLTVSGLIDGRPWSQSVDLSDAIDSPAVAKLWANRRIADVEAARWAGETNDATTDEAIARIGLAYSLVTSQTSLVAIDETPARPEGVNLTREELPLLLPAGWDFDVLFGGQAAKAAKPGGVQPAGEAEAMDLPQTATGYVGLIGQGLLFLALGLGGLALRRAQRQVRA
ncbi:marine proteobacterial sortase target protein [Sphingobium chungbukense]|uniref:Cell wall anchor domain-containing protein n=1 Tax=Sphingobium chungbukense TaxID=56193 RepID=A0A0M3ASX6_9SPHN|nr:marine proteobacterial sortase target protein [Sphingobium chungbukense]KKW92046.1 cell wall anchor domain-containing protein [Sphingobium chungbukense]